MRGSETYSVTVDHRNAHVVREKSFEVREQVGVDEVTGVVEADPDVLAARGCVVDIDADSVLDLGRVQVVDPVSS